MEITLTEEMLYMICAITGLMTMLHKYKVLDNYKYKRIIYHLIPLVMCLVASFGGFFHAEGWRNELITGLALFFTITKSYDLSKESFRAVKKKRE
jgi:hypothetical protein